MDLPGVFTPLGLPVDGSVFSGSIGLAEFSAHGAALVEKGFFILRQFVTRLSLLRFGFVHRRRSPGPGIPVARGRTPLRKSAPAPRPPLPASPGCYGRSSSAIFFDRVFG